MTQYSNPADEQIARITEQLDALTGELAAALAQQQTPAGELTGVERAADILAQASKLAGLKGETREQRAALERYAEAITAANVATRQVAQFDKLQRRAQALLREATVGHEIAKSRRSTTKSAMNTHLRQLQDAGIERAWIDAINDQVNASLDNAEQEALEQSA